MLLSKLRPLAEGRHLPGACGGGRRRPTLVPVGAPPRGPGSSAPPGPPKKAAIALANGCSEAIIYTAEDFAKAVDRLTSGRGVDVGL